MVAPGRLLAGERINGDGRLRLVRRSTIPGPKVHRITAVQAVLALVLTGLIFVTRGSVDGYSLLTGSLIQMAGTAYFAFRAFRYQGASRIGAVVGQMYRGESGKLVLSAALFAVVFAFVRPINGFFVFVGYLVMQAVQVVMTVVLIRK